MIEQLKQGGAGILTSLLVKDPQALIQSADSTTQPPKGKKQELLQRVNEFDKVKDAVGI